MKLRIFQAIGGAPDAPDLPMGAAGWYVRAVAVLLFVILHCQREVPLAPLSPL